MYLNLRVLNLSLLILYMILCIFSVVVMYFSIDLFYRHCHFVSRKFLLVCRYTDLRLCHIRICLYYVHFFVNHVVKNWYYLRVSYIHSIVGMISLIHFTKSSSDFTIP